MNVLVASFWEGLIHATGFSMLGIVVYLALRRWSPAAGALAAAASLVVMVLVALLGFCPWPRWEAGQSLESMRLAIVNSSLRAIEAGLFQRPSHSRPRLPQGHLWWPKKTECRLSRRKSRRWPLGSSRLLLGNGGNPQPSTAAHRGAGRAGWSW